MSARRERDVKFEAFLGRLKEMKRTEVFIGVLASGKANEIHESDGTRPVTNVDVATWNEFGTEVDGEEHVPERSFLRSTIDVKAREMTKVAAAEFRVAVAGDQSVASAYDRIGAATVGMVQKRMEEGIGPANAPSTIKRKGSSKPLINKGQLRSAITHEVKT